MKQTNNFKIYNEPFQETLQRNGLKIDAIITDPPYNVGYKYNEYKDDLEDNEYLELFAALDQYMQLFKTNMSIMHYPIQAVEIFTKMIGPPDHITTWVYNSNTPKQSRLIFNYGTVYKKQVRQPYKNPNDKRIKARIEAGKIDAKAYDWWYVNQVKNVSKIKSGNPHSCPLPIDIAIKMVLLTTKEGDTVYDPFTGSGTIGLACLMTGRKFIGSEIDTLYSNSAKQILENFENKKTTEKNLSNSSILKNWKSDNSLIENPKVVLKDNSWINEEDPFPISALPGLSMFVLEIEKKEE